MDNEKIRRPRRRTTVCEGAHAAISKLVNLVAMTALEPVCLFHENPVAPTRAAFAMRRAFTLLELIIVIAIVGFASAIIVFSLDDVMASVRKPAPLEVLRKAVDAAWYGAASGHKRMALSYDVEKRALMVRTLETVSAVTPETTSAEDSPEVPQKEPEVAAEVAVFAFEDERVLDVRFTRVPDDGGGALQVTETAPFPRLVFSPWGGVVPTIVEVDIDGAIYRYQLDMFGGGLEAVK
ncbi:MAG: type II secretion system GspH family protein [Puniceicoccales bacterium]|nr:type II secretion system GspH family protein [Puniceicoccales bacterium]